jgi:hypothetical protein
MQRSFSARADLDTCHLAAKAIIEADFLIISAGGGRREEEEEEREEEGRSRAGREEEGRRKGGGWTKWLIQVTGI